MTRTRTDRTAEAEHLNDPGNPRPSLIFVGSDTIGKPLASSSGSVSFCQCAACARPTTATAISLSLANSGRLSSASFVGRLAGVVDGEVAMAWARRQARNNRRAVLCRARKAAESFDADLLIELRGRTGQVSVLMEHPDRPGILAACVDHDPDDDMRVYREYAAVFAAEINGLDYSINWWLRFARRAG